MELQKDPLKVLKEFWGVSSFRPLQQKAVESALEKQDSFVCFPTGGGKSLCYQVASMASEGICIVVSPLIALIKNQVDDLKQRGIKATALAGAIPYKEIDAVLDNCIYGNFKFLYLSPERLQQEIVQQRIKAMNVNLIAIDEAHCISQWGNDFRPSYRDCKILRDLLPGVPLMALTASATQKVSEDIIESLQLNQPLQIKKSVHRPNIAYHVLTTKDKPQRLKQILQKYQGSAIVYVNNRKATREISQILQQSNISADYFHGGLENWEKNEKLKQWMQGQNRVMVATNAFGMGIDKADVETVIHYNFPDTLEGYYQESGRAGRNGSRAYAVILQGPNDIEQLKQQYLGALPDVHFIKLLYNKLNNYFQISYGEGENQQFALNLKDFCNVYQLPPTKTYNGLKLLDRQSVLSLLETTSKRTHLQFTTGQHQLFQYLDKHPFLEDNVQALLRTYPGIFDYLTPIKLAVIAKKTSSAEKKIHQQLEQLEKDGICQYQVNNADTSINFLTPREDDKTINVISRAIENYNQIKADKLQNVIEYVTNNQVCKSVQLLQYFDQNNSQDCGVCSVCTKRQQKIAPDILKIAKEEVLKALQKQAYPLEELTQQVTFKEMYIKAALEKLIKEKHIFKDKNECYTIQ